MKATKAKMPTTAKKKAADTLKKAKAAQKVKSPYAKAEKKATWSVRLFPKEPKHNWKEKHFLGQYKFYHITMLVFEIPSFKGPSLCSDP